MNTAPRVIQVAVPSPLRKVFDYLPLTSFNGEWMPGMRVKVSFGRKQVVGIVTGVADSSDCPTNKLKRINQVIDTQPIFHQALFTLLTWAASYYHHPLGEVLSHALPKMLRQGDAAQASQEEFWLPILDGEQNEAKLLMRAPKQRRLYLQLCELYDLHTHPHGLSWHELQALGIERLLLKKLEEKKLVVKRYIDNKIKAVSSSGVADVALNVEQAQAVDAVLAKREQFNCFLLDGVTGSGKTEVYLRIVQQIINAGRQALILIPEIGLTPQTVTRFAERLGVPIGLLHSNLTDQERLDTWLKSKSGDISVIIGTRSAIFSDFNDLGVIVVDESHDASFKQWDGFKYHARDLAVRRAQLHDIPVLLGSATPALPSLYNAWQEKFTYLRLTQRATDATMPEYHVVDMRHNQNKQGLADSVIERVGQTIAAGNQVLFFLNRRGYAPVLMCHECGFIAECERCQSPLTLHQQPASLRCHHCGKQQRVLKQCPDCQSEQLMNVGLGTQRLEESLQSLFPTTQVLRIDRDSTRKKGALEAKLNVVHQGMAQLLVGTQMLAKGHHFANVTLVVMLDIDGALYSADYVAVEQMAQQIIQVAGRAGREEQKGSVMLQTYHPDHPMLQTLLSQGYQAVAKQLLAEREAAALPPYTALALFRTEAVNADNCRVFLNEVFSLLQQQQSEANLLLPMPAPIEKRAGRYRWQLQINATARRAIHQLLRQVLPEIEALPSARKVRWSIDIDPIETL